MTDDWERGFSAGYRHGLNEARRDIGRDMGFSEGGNTKPKVKKKRKASAYNRRYSAAFRKVAPKYKTKSGKWIKGGFAKANKAAHKLAKK